MTTINAPAYIRHQPIPSPVALGNGEVWELRGIDWHLIGYRDDLAEAWGNEENSQTWNGDYSPVGNSAFSSYANCFD